MENIENVMDELIEQKRINNEVLEGMNIRLKNIDESLRDSHSIISMELEQHEKTQRTVKNICVHIAATSILTSCSVVLLNIHQELIPVINSTTTECNHNVIRNSIVFISILTILGSNIKIKLNHDHQKFIEEHSSYNEDEFKSYSGIKRLIKNGKRENKQ